MKNQKGITLVALVITIIVLLILAGVSISLVIGNNGVLTQASTSVVKNNTAAAKQDIEMAVAACYTKYMAEWAEDSSKAWPSEYLTADNGTTAGTIRQNLSDTNATITAVVYSTGNAAGTNETNNAFKYVYGGTNSDGRHKIVFQVDANGKVTFNDALTE